MLGGLLAAPWCPVSAVGGAPVTFAAAASSGAAADTVTAELLAPLAERNLRRVDAGVAALADTGAPQALAVLEALQAGELYAWQTPPRVLMRREAGGAVRWVDPRDGATVTLDDTPGADPPRRIRVSNRIRRTVRDAIARLSLSSDEAAVRLAAARQFADAPDPDQLALIDGALARERVPRVRRALETARAAVLVTDPDRVAADRAAAIDTLRRLGTAQARSTLLAAPFAPDTPLARQRDRAVAAIDQQLALWALLQNLWYGVSLGSVLLLAALGLAITFGVMRVINMAHGEMVMLGAYTTFVVQQALQALAPALAGASLLLALPAAFVVTAAAGALIERTVIRRLYGRPLETLLATWGISLILQQLVRSVFGASNRPVQTAPWMSGALELGGLSFTWNRLVILALALAVLAGVALALWRTTLGLQIRAVTQNRAMAESMGIRAERVDLVTFALGSGIAGLAGVALSQIDNVSPNLGQGYIIDSFMVIVFGGVGNLLGTLMGALSLGVTSKLVEPLAGAVAAKVLILVFIIVFIQFRPQGMFPQRGRAASE